MFAYAPPGTAARGGALAGSLGLAGRRSPMLGSPDFGTDVAEGFKSLKEPLNFFLVSGGWLAGDIVGHQLFEATRGAKTPGLYYRNKLLLAPVFLLAGRILSDVIGGPPLARAATLGTTANLLMQIKYLLSYPAEFNTIVFLLHEMLLVPLSLLIVGKQPGAILLLKEGY
jgi:hypothetical protein